MSRTTWAISVHMNAGYVRYYLACHSRPGEGIGTSRAEMGRITRCDTFLCENYKKCKYKLGKESREDPNGF